VHTKTAIMPIVTHPLFVVVAITDDVVNSPPRRLGPLTDMCAESSSPLLRKKRSSPRLVGTAASSFTNGSRTLADSLATESEGLSESGELLSEGIEKVGDAGLAECARCSSAKRLADDV